MLASVLGLALTAAAPQTVAALEQLAPSTSWVRRPLQGLDAELLVLPTKLPNRFVLRHGRVAEATLESAAPLFAPLDAAQAARLADALEPGEVVSEGAPERLRAAGFAVTSAAPASPLGSIQLSRLVLRGAQSVPQLVAVRLGFGEDGRVDRREALLAELFPATAAPGDNALPPRTRGPAADRSHDLARFVAAVRGTAL